MWIVDVMSEMLNVNCKMFRRMKQHEKSKKHIERLAALHEEFSSELLAAGLAKP